MSGANVQLSKSNESLFDRVYRNRFGISLLVWFGVAIVLAAHWYYLNTYMEQSVSSEDITNLGDKVVYSDKAAKRLMQHLIANPAPNRRQWEAIEADVLRTEVPNAGEETCKGSLWSCLVNQAKKAQSEWIHEYDLK